jgi:hypothetical protein
MKPYTFLSAVVLMLLAVAFTGCTPLRDMGGDEEYYERGPRSTAGRIYVDDPYAGTVILERDPYTGRYYQISPVGIGGRFGNDPFLYRNNRFYGGFNQPIYRNGGYYRQAPRGGVHRPSTSAPTPQQQQERKEQQQEARRKILGGN